MIHTNKPSFKTWNLPSKVDRNVFYTVKLVTEQHFDTQRKRQRHKPAVKITRSARNVRIEQKRDFLISTAIACYDLHRVSRDFYTLREEELKNGDQWPERGILQFTLDRNQTYQFVLDDAYGDILDLHVALVHVNPASHTMTNADHCGIQMARHVNFWNEVDIARAQQAVKIVNVVFVQEEIKRWRIQLSLHKRMIQNNHNNTTAFTTTHCFVLPP